MSPNDCYPVPGSIESSLLALGEGIRTLAVACGGDVDDRASTLGTGGLMRRVLAWGSAWWLLCSAMVWADDAARPWEQPPFSASAKDIVAAIQLLPVDEELGEQ